MLLDEAQNLVATVPELKKEIAKLEKREEVCKAKLAESNEQLVDMRIKNIQWKIAQEDRIAANQSLEKQEERKRMELLKASLEKTHEEDMARLIQVGKKEMQEVEEQKMRLLEERKKMLVEQREEEEMLQKLTQLHDSEEREAFVLMQRLNPPHVPNRLLVVH